MALGAGAIRRLCTEHGMITPFREGYRRDDGLSGGLSLVGYDVTVEFDAEGERDRMSLSKGTFELASTIERFCMPRDVVGIVHDKSTWARHGLAVQNTVIEPGWKGYLTLELSYHGTWALQLRRGMPIAQVVFHRVEEPDEEGYTGKYQDQRRGPVYPR